MRQRFNRREIDMKIGIGMNIIAGIMLGLSAMFIYLLPTYIAIKRKHRKTLTIYILNLFFGWTLLIWVLTFGMACWKQDKQGAN